MAVIHLNPDYAQPGCNGATDGRACGSRATVMVTDDAGVNLFFCDDHKAQAPEVLSTDAAVVEVADPDFPTGSETEPSTSDPATSTPES